MLILSISKDFDELLQDSSLASVAALCKLRRIMVMAVDLSIMLIVTVLCTKHSRTY